VDADADHGRLARLERGEIVLASTYTIALSLFLFVMLANVIVAMYGRGVVRAALDEGVRVGSRAPLGAEQCELRVAEALGQLLGGAMGDGVAFSCAETGDAITAAATVHFDGWLPLVPDFSFDVGASAVKERLP
jgi:hypothetical protein